MIKQNNESDRTSQTFKNELEWQLLRKGFVFIMWHIHLYI